MTQEGTSTEDPIDVVGEYLAAFLAVEQDWGVIDGLMHAHRPEEALMYYDMALRHIHKVMEELEEQNVKPWFLHGFDRHSKAVRDLLLDEGKVKSTALKLVERALSKYPKYYVKLKKEAEGEEKKEEVEG